MNKKVQDAWGLFLDSVAYENLKIIYDNWEIIENAESNYNITLNMGDWFTCKANIKKYIKINNVKELGNCGTCACLFGSSLLIPEIFELSGIKDIKTLEDIKKIWDKLHFSFGDHSLRKCPLYSALFDADYKDDLHHAKARLYFILKHRCHLSFDEFSNRSPSEIYYLSDGIESGNIKLNIVNEHLGESYD